jgi:hypothetical protein
MLYIIEACCHIGCCSFSLNFQDRNLTLGSFSVRTIDG